MINIQFRFSKAESCHRFDYERLPTTMYLNIYDRFERVSFIKKMEIFDSSSLESECLALSIQPKIHQDTLIYLDSQGDLYIDMSEETYRHFGWTGTFIRRSLRYGKLFPSSVLLYS
jgi:hypothetical protein